MRIIAIGISKSNQVIYPNIFSLSSERYLLILSLYDRLCLFPFLPLSLCIGYPFSTRDFVIARHDYYHETQSICCGFSTVRADKPPTKQYVRGHIYGMFSLSSRTSSLSLHILMFILINVSFLLDSRRICNGCYWFSIHPINLCLPIKSSWICTCLVNFHHGKLSLEYAKGKNYHCKEER